MFQPEQLKSKLSTSCGLLAKLIYYVTTDILRTLYFSIFDSIMRYGFQVWGEKQSATLNDIERLQNKPIKIMCFKSKYDVVNPSYKKLKILRLRDMLTPNNCQFVQDQINGKLAGSFNDYFKRTRNQ